MLHPGIGGSTIFWREKMGLLLKPWTSSGIVCNMEELIFATPSTAFSTSETELDCADWFKDCWQSLYGCYSSARIWSRLAAALCMFGNNIYISLNEPKVAGRALANLSERPYPIIYVQKQKVGSPVLPHFSPHFIGLDAWIYSLQCA